MRALSNMRPASKAMGDDVSLTRFIKTKGNEHDSHRKVPSMPENAAGTKFPQRVIPPDRMTNMLVSGHSNVKIGRDVRKGKHKGYRIYTLSLEERATCPETCQHWRNCYGNNMPFAKRVDHSHPRFFEMLALEVRRLTNRKKGILIRLHALGDFFSVSYAALWHSMLRNIDNLAIFGYTAHDPMSVIGQMISLMNAQYPERCKIRFSNGCMEEMCTVGIKDATDKPSNAFICPEQTGKTRCCATCGACWSGNKNVAFIEH